MISLCLTTLNEGDRCWEWYRAICAQTVHPDEIVILDGGSTDGSREKLRWMGKLYLDGTCNIAGHHSPVAHGRNLAAKYAKGDILIFTDLGCIPSPDWISGLVFRLTTCDVSYGICTVRATDALSEKIRELVGISTQSARSLAIRRDAFEKLGGFPEVSLCAEDTLFAKRVEESGLSIGYSYAYVEWIPPRDARTFLKQQRRYSTGDGISRLRFGWYARIPLKHLLFPVYWPYLWLQYDKAFWLKLRLDLARVIGYTHGLINRNAQHSDTRMEGT